MNLTQRFRFLSSNSKPRRLSVRLGLDSLERRDTPSGTVTAVLSGKTWKITGDDAANDITIDPTGAGSFTLTGNNTIVTGDTDPTGVENIVIKMKKGGDSITFNTTDTPYTLAGYLNIDGGADANAVSIADMTFNKYLTVKNGTNATSTDDFFLEDSTVVGKLTVNNGHGDTYTYLSRSAAGTSSVGSLQVTNGTGLDNTFVNDFNVNGNAKISNGAPNAANSGGNTQFYNVNNGTQSKVLGNVAVSYKGGVNTGGERDGIWDYDVNGNVSYKYGSGDGDVRFDGYTINEAVLFLGNLSIKAGGKLVVKVAGQGYEDVGLQLNGNLTINGGVGEDNIDLRLLDVQGKTVINTGKGADYINIDDSSFEKFSVNMGHGNDIFDLDYSDFTVLPVIFYDVVKVHLGNDDDQLRVGFPADDTASVEFGANATFWGGSGTDLLDQNNFSVTTGFTANFIQ